MSNWKSTADAFESLIERPKMTQKLLEKPPFKYIFDIIAETTKKTGFANGNSIFTQGCMKAMNLRQIIMGKRLEKLLTYRK